MQIGFFNINNNYTAPLPQNLQKRIATSPLAPLAHDTVSFGAMKKTQFDGVNLAVVEKFKAPIGKFNSNDDLQNWASKQIKEIRKTDFGGRQAETKIQRKAMLNEWTAYVLTENDAYNNATALLILSAVTKDLKPDNDKLPPVLNKGVLADCISEIDKNIRADKKYQFDLNKMYETKLRALYLEDTNTGETESKWIIIPSKDNDPENFEENVKKLKTLSHKNWCTKSFNAEPYLKDGDFHVYLENGHPKLGVRFVGDEIQEIQGENNNGKIPIAYFDEMKKHIDENRLKLSENAQDEINSAEKIKIQIERVRHDLKEKIEKKDVKAIFEYFGSTTEEDEDGFLAIIGDYGLKEYSYSDVGIDENWLFEKVKKITGNAYFNVSQVKDLGNLEAIGGFANFNGSQVESLGNLKTIGKDADFQNSKLKDLGNLETICGYANFYGSQVKDLGNLEIIGDNANFYGSQVKDLGNLEIIGDNAYFNDSQVKDLGKLKSIGGKVYINDCLLSEEDKEKLKAMQNGNSN